MTENSSADAAQSRQAGFVRYCLKFRKIRLTRVRFRTRLLYLIRDGYLTLETLPGTRNSKRIILTDAGQALMQTTIDPLKQAEDAAYSKFSDAERQCYLELTRRLNTNLREELQAQLKRRTL